MWDGQQHICEPVTCSLPSLLNGNYTYIYLEKCSNSSLIQPVGCEIEPNCDEGYELITGSQRSCDSSGQWSCTDAMCLRIACKVPRTIPGWWYQYENGSKIYDNKVYYSDIVELQCNKGYFTNVSETRICQADQTLSGGDIGCYIVTCGYPAESVVTNGRYRLSSGEWFAPGHTVKYNETIYVECNAGFIFRTGSKNRTIQDSASWSGEGAVCAAVTLKSIEHLLYMYSVLTENTTFPYKTTVNVTCINGPLAARSEGRRFLEKPDSSDTLPLSGGVIGAVVGLSVLCSILVVVVVLLVVWRKKIGKQDKRYADLLPVQINSETPDRSEYVEIQEIHAAASEASPTKEDTLNKLQKGKADMVFL